MVTTEKSQTSPNPLILTTDHSKWMEGWTLCLGRWGFMDVFQAGHSMVSKQFAIWIKLDPLT